VETGVISVRDIRDSCGRGEGKDHVKSTVVKLRYLSPVPVSRIEHPDDVASHYDGGYTYAGYGGCTSQQQMIKAKEGNRESRSTRDVFSGAMPLLMTKIQQCFTKRASTADKGGFRSHRENHVEVDRKDCRRSEHASICRFVRFANSLALSNDIVLASLFRE